MKLKFLNKRSLFFLAVFALIFASPLNSLFFPVKAQAAVSAGSFSALNFKTGFIVIHTSQNIFDQSAAQETLPQFQNAEAPLNAAGNFTQNTFAYSNTTSSAASIVVSQSAAYAPLTVRNLPVTKTLSVRNPAAELNQNTIQQGQGEQSIKAVVRSNSDLIQKAVSILATRTQNTFSPHQYSYYIEKGEQFVLRC